MIKIIYLGIIHKDSKTLQHKGKQWAIIAVRNIIIADSTMKYIIFFTYWHMHVYWLLYLNLELSIRNISLLILIAV